MIKEPTEMIKEPTLINNVGNTDIVNPILEPTLINNVSNADIVNPISKPTQTTEDMFKENNTLHLKWIGAPFYVSMIILYSWITVQLTGTSLWTTPISWFVDICIFYTWHTQAHHVLPWIPFNNFCHKCHDLHHFHFFPANNFYGSKHATEWRENANKGFYLLNQSLPLHELGFLESLQNESFGLAMAVISTFIKYKVLDFSLPTLIAMIIQGTLVNFIGNYLHLSFHVENYWMNEYKLYRELKYLHYLHHTGDTKQNYAIFSLELTRCLRLTRERRVFKY